MKVDYIVVGCGLAGIAFCEELRIKSKSFIVFDNNSQQSSIVAAGMYNPVVLKRFSEVWNAKELLQLASKNYKALEDLLGVKLDTKLRIRRLFSSIEEQNKWFTAADNPNLEPFLSTKLITNTNSSILAPFSFGEVLRSGRIDTNLLINSYKSYLENTEQIKKSKFFYNELKINADSLSYQDITANSLVFCEGYGIKQNPFFDYLPLNGTKGELIIIQAPKLKLEYALKSSVFVIPLDNDRYMVGATYNRKDKTNKITLEGKEELVKKLKKFIICDFEVVGHVAGIRPTTTDRRPIVGKHPKFQNINIINGLGSRGVMLAPYVAKALYNYIENTVNLDSEISIERFTS